MGSKMSFSRGSSDQNTVSELTSVPSNPRNSAHAPADCKQTPEDKRCSEDDLDSGWREDMKATELVQPAPESRSSGRAESDGLVGSDTAGGTNCQRGEHASPHAGMEAKSQITFASVCSSTTDSRGKPVGGRRRPGRPRKVKPSAKHKNDPKSADLPAVQHEEISTTIPLPACLENHNSDDVPNAADDPLIHNSGPHAVPDVKEDEGGGGGGPGLPRRRRGRPRKSDLAAPAASANKVSVPARKLRSREQFALTQDGKTEPDIKADPEQAEPTPPASSYTLNTQGIKRRKKKMAHRQVPAKLSRLDISQEASPVLSNDTSGGETAADRPVEGNTDKQETDKDGGERAPPTGDCNKQTATEQQADLKENTSLLRPQPAAEPEVFPSAGFSRLDLISPTQSDEPKMSADMDGSEDLQSKNSLRSPKNTNTLNTDPPPATDVVTSSAQPPKPDAPLPAVKAVEIEVGSLNPVSETNSPASLQYSANTPAPQPQGPNHQRNTFRRKKGGKRRRWINTACDLDKEGPPNVKAEDVEIEVGSLNPVSETNSPASLQYSANTPAPQPQGPNHQRNTFRRKKGGKRRRWINTACDLDKEGPPNDDGNVIYTKKGGKTLLKCGYCGQVFKFLSQFVIHQRVHTGERPFKCPECGKGFSKNSNLNLHLKTHRKSKIYQKCPFCKIKFSCSEYASHMQMHAQELEPEPESSKSEKPGGGSNHDNGPAPHASASSEKREQKVCQYCGKTFPFQSALIRHVRVHTGEKPYKCDICGKAFGQAYFLRVHELTHWSVKRYNCTRCEKSFTHYSNAKNHTCRPSRSGDDGSQPNRRVKPSLTYTCHICKNVFDHLQEFNTHMRNHTGAKLYRCLYCDKLFGVLSEFNTHRSQCTGKRSASTSASAGKSEQTMSLIQYSVPALRCSSQQNSTSQPTAGHGGGGTPKKTARSGRKKRSSDLRKPFQSTVIPAHPLSHLVSKLNKLDNRSDPRKYLCPRCGRLFRHMGRLRAHMLTHAPGQSYTCACCGKTLENWKKLWHHQRVHRQRRGRFTCPQCGQGFRFVEPYKKHMSEHPEYQWNQVRPKKVSLPYQCDQCRCSFKTLDLLFSHQLCHSSAQDALKDSDFDLALDDHAAQSDSKTFGLPTNNHTVTLLTEPEEYKYPDPASQESPVISFVHNQGVYLEKTSHHPASEYSVQDQDTSQDRMGENSLGKPITPLRTVKRHVTQNASISNEGPPDYVKCAVCDLAFPAIPDLYQHYLQHARGQV